MNYEVVTGYPTLLTMRNTMNRSKLEKKKFILSYSSQFIMKGSWAETQSRKLEAGTKAEL